MRVSIERRIWNVLISIDQVVYVIVTLGAGNPDETLSSAAYRADKSGKIAGRIFRPIIDFLMKWREDQHCKNAFFAEMRTKDFWEDRT